MEYAVHDVIELANKEKYIIADVITSNNKKYYYIISVNEEGKEITGKCKIITIDNVSGSDVISIITNKEELAIIAPGLASHYA